MNTTGMKAMSMSMKSMSKARTLSRRPVVPHLWAEGSFQKGRYRMQVVVAGVLVRSLELI